MTHLLDIDRGKKSDFRPKPRITAIGAICWVAAIMGMSLLAVLWFSRASSNDQARATADPSPTSGSNLSVYDGNQQRIDLTIIIGQLSAEDEDIREAAKKRIVQLAVQSDDNRHIIIGELLRRVTLPTFKNLLAVPAGSYLFVKASEIFGELRATEAIEFLTDCLDCTAITEHASDTYHHKPALRALLGMQSAVPKLSEILLTDQVALRRKYAAICLGNIGGSQARAALSRALVGEKDNAVRESITGSISAIDSQP